MKSKGIYARRLIAFIIVAAMSLSVLVFPDGEVNAATASVKSVSVTNLSSRRLTLTKGKTFAMKISVQTTGNAPKQVGYSTSNGKVATASTKGVITARGKGTAKITVYSKADKTKKCVITVTVKEPLPTIKWVSMKRKTYIYVSLTNSYDLKATDFAVYSKSYKAGRYRKRCKIQSAVSKNKKVYTIKLVDSDAAGLGSWFKVKIPKLSSSKETSYFVQGSDEMVYIYRRLAPGKQVYDYYDMGRGYSVVSVKGLPAGVSYGVMPTESGIRIRYWGAVRKGGAYRTTVVAKDETGAKKTLNYIWVCKDDTYADDLYVENTTVNMCTQLKEVKISDQVVIYSSDMGNLSTEIVGETYGCRMSSVSSMYVLFDKPGTYPVKLKVTNKKTGVSKTCTVTYKVIKGVKLKGQILDNKGNPVSDGRYMVKNVGTGTLYSNEYTGYLDENGRFEIMVEPGAYDIYGYYEQDSINAAGAVIDKTVKTDTTVSFKLNEYKAK